jgi:hypothetical protein
MEYREPKKRVTKNDKNIKKQTYSQKHIRIKTLLLEKPKQYGPLQPS